MAGAAPHIGVAKSPDLKVAIITASWHQDICDALVAGAKRACADADVKVVEVFSVPGSFELPLAAQFAFEKGFGVGSTATVKVRATTRMALYNKTGEKVFAFSESERSKKTSVMISGIPIMSPENTQPQIAIPI